MTLCFRGGVLRYEPFTVRSGLASGMASVSIPFYTRSRGLFCDSHLISDLSNRRAGTIGAVDLLLWFVYQGGAVAVARVAVLLTFTSMRFTLFSLFNTMAWSVGRR